MQKTASAEAGDSQDATGAPTRLPINWRAPEFWDKDALNAELERVYDICHGCRRCVNLCQAFPTLFDLVDESGTMEVDGVDKADYNKVVKECFLCDLCYMTKCPYVPPHEWNVDFPHLMLRAKMVENRESGKSLRDKLLGSMDFFGRAARIPGVNTAINKGLNNKLMRKSLGIHEDAGLPMFQRKNIIKELIAQQQDSKKTGDRTARDEGDTPIAPPVVASPSPAFAKVYDEAPEPGVVYSMDMPPAVRPKVALFATCSGVYNFPDMVEVLYRILRHNEVEVKLIGEEKCCGMPRLEQGDIVAVEKDKDHNIPLLYELVSDGYEIIAPVPSCVLMFKQELPLLFPDDEKVQAVGENIHDPGAWLYGLHQSDWLDTEFRTSLGKVAYHAPCHTRVQNIGLKTPALLGLVPDTAVTIVERCSGHDGTYGIKAECYESAVKLARPAARKVNESSADYFTGDCMLAGMHIARLTEMQWKHPMELLSIAYGLTSQKN